MASPPSAATPVCFPPCHAFVHAKVRHIGYLISVFFCLALSARGQLQQPFVYMTGGGIATRNDQTGTLTATAESPLAVPGFPVVIDAKGRFLFAAGNDSIHMYELDSLSGAYTEVPNSPFASVNTNGPILLAPSLPARIWQW